MKIEIFNETEDNLEEYIETIKKVLVHGLDKLKTGDVTFNIIFVNNPYIHELNKNYRNIDRETDVITFALEDDKTFNPDERILGDIYISIDRARSQAEEYGHSFLREISFLAVHGFYHLLGYDHQTKEEEKVMFGKQEEVLQDYGISREN
jgi:probable rRNA maturation factor